MGEIGGEFHWLGSPPTPFLPWPQPNIFLSTGQAAVLHIWQNHIPAQPSRRLWIPEYFCRPTAKYWQDNGIEVLYYLDQPAHPLPDWTTLSPRAGDFVLAVNYFGVRTAEPWQTWHASHPQVIILEDHTHDPMSEWARTSKADYAFASLRKTLPIPEGAIVWSPSQHVLPPAPTVQDWRSSAFKLAAMLWKADYLRGGETDGAQKQIFRQFQTIGEEALESLPPQQIAPWTQALLETGFPIQWRTSREENVRYLLQRLPSSSFFSPLFDDWQSGCCPFNVVLLADTHMRRDDLRKHLLAADIYPPVHWPLPTGAHPDALDTALRILTIPVDYRYSLTDLDRITAVLSQALDNFSSKPTH